MFKPNFRITNKIINHIVDIAAARELILNASLLPRWEVKLRKEAVVKMAHHSTSIEGNPLTLEQVKNLLAGKEIAAWEKKGQIFLNEKQRKILKHLQTNLRITTKEYQNIFNVSERTARGHLNELVNLELIKPVGPAKGRYYVLA